MRFLQTELKNRSVLASGICGVTISSLKRVYREGAGLLTTKSVGPEGRKGHPGPVIYDWGEGLINAVGLSNPGIDDFISQYSNDSVDFPIAISIYGKTEADFPILAKKLLTLKYDFLEVNISCPNVLDEFGTPFSFSPELTSTITRSVKDVAEKPVIVKLSPNTHRLIEVAKSAADAGADALCIMNTLGPGMVINIDTGVPVLSNRAGGISGQAVLPLTVRNVFEIYKEVTVPIIGTGGISSWEGAVQVMMAGATLYGIGSAVYTEGINIFKHIENGIQAFLQANSFESMEEIIGLSHRIKKVSFYNSSIDSSTKKEKEKLPTFTVFPVSDIRKPEKSSVTTIMFQVAAQKRPSPGQFYMLWIPGVDQKPFSVSYSEDGLLGFSFVKRGPFSSALCELKRGDPVGLLGPLGRGFSLKHKNYLLAGGGIGCAPLVYAARHLKAIGNSVYIIAGGKDSSSLCWIDEFLPDSNYEIFYCTEDGSFGSKGMVTDHLQSIIDNKRPEFALLCGPELFIKKAIDIMEERGIPGEAGLERMMKCGMGLCGSCVLDHTGERVCMEGPVFSFSDISRIHEFGKYRRDESGTIEDL
ncbi:MAG: dihydroorotate dehydrogenase [Spirochaetota bacterium]|nr:MAG: dihydroorotate dehydrogenase [Spirochaetota bacterium]